MKLKSTVMSVLLAVTWVIRAWLTVFPFEPVSSPTREPIGRTAGESTGKAIATLGAGDPSSASRPESCPCGQFSRFIGTKGGSSSFMYSIQAGSSGSGHMQMPHTQAQLVGQSEHSGQASTATGGKPKLKTTARVSAVLIRVLFDGGGSSWSRHDRGDAPRFQKARFRDFSCHKNFAAGRWSATRAVGAAFLTVSQRVA